jgi:hypothetical protein
MSSRSDLPSQQNRERIARIVIGLVTLMHVAGCASSAEKNASDFASADSVTLTTTSSTSTTTTEPQHAGAVEFHIDPVAQYLPGTGFLVDIIKKTEDVFPVLPGTKAIMYHSENRSFDWVAQTTKELGCFNDLRRGNRGFDSVGWGRECGFLMRIDAMNYQCTSPVPCKQNLTVAAHEFFHVVALQKLQPCSCNPRIYGNKVPNWLNEGIADYVGYAMVYGDESGNLTLPQIRELRDALKARGHSVDFNPSLAEVEQLFQGDLSLPRGSIYDRSFLAVSLLVERFGEEAVLVDYFDNVVVTGHYTTGFVETFGISESDFDKEFQTWIATL